MEKSLKEQIKEELMLLKKIGLDDLPEIARRLGYEKNPFTKLKDEDYAGSTQLLAGLKMLLELETLKPEVEESRRLFQSFGRHVAKNVNDIQRTTDLSSHNALNDADWKPLPSAGGKPTTYKKRRKPQKP